MRTTALDESADEDDAQKKTRNAADIGQVRRGLRANSS